ncbi:germination protein YpeB [Desulfoscipio gibsoniae]|uniref:Germination protein YpeB n=1 Tax=Desulfoscipio gibsoniae DSM 7213 TaxID=767817 RepID=R4KW72_9FIRM|nr:germination protein YpeB [Desulfoscipio gibsoniae]AGL03871.1 germination protein YpeB [Desulfoscipio gibsoniae DSM 7213]
MKKWFAALGVLAIAALAIGYWGYQEHNSKLALQTAVNNNYQRAFYNLADHVQTMEVLLGKSLVLAGPEKNVQFFDEIWQQSNQALDSLTQLPVGDAILGRTAKFITQLGDYSNTLARQVAEGKPLTREQWDTVNRLYEQSSSLNKELNKIHNSIADGTLNLYELAISSSNRLAREGQKLASGNFQTMDRQMQAYPTLIYDGPFSDHMEQGRARGVTGKNVTQAKARSIAMQYFDNPGDENVLAQVTGEVKGNIRAYRVEIARRQGGAVVGEPTVADVSVQGGHLIWMVTPRNVAEAVWSIDRARSRAEDYLRDHGYENTQISYHQRNDNTVTFNYALKQDDIIIYPDLVKVTVALDNGQVVAMDARGYLMSHHKRNLDKPKLTEREARVMVSERLKIDGTGRLAVIPVGVEKEILTWEFRGTQGGETYLVYINALTGDEENVLRLVNTDDGELTL